jgi:hypothetical protein
MIRFLFKILIKYKKLWNDYYMIIITITDHMTIIAV